MTIPEARIWLTALVLQLVACLPAFAQLGVDDGIEVPFPETGMWNSLDGSGTGIIFEVQDGFLVGALFGADASGDNTWVLFHGALVPRISEEFGSPVHIGWMLESTLYRTSGSACIVECPAGDNPGAPVTAEAGQIKLEFTGRSFATYRVDDGPAKRIAPFYFGILARQFDPDDPLARIPELTGIWVYIIDEGDEDPSIDDGRGVVRIGTPDVTRTLAEDGTGTLQEIVYPVEFSSGETFELTCEFPPTESDTAESTPNCFMNLGLVPTVVEVVPFELMTDSRFTLTTSGQDFAEVARWEFFRVGYD